MHPKITHTQVAFWSAARDPACDESSLSARLSALLGRPQAGLDHDRRRQFLVSCAALVAGTNTTSTTPTHGSSDHRSNSGNSNSSSSSGKEGEEVVGWSLCRVRAHPLSTGHNTTVTIVLASVQPACSRSTVLAVRTTSCSGGVSSWVLLCVVDSESCKGCVAWSQFVVDVDVVAEMTMSTCARCYGVFLLS